MGARMWSLALVVVVLALVGVANATPVVNPYVTSEVTALGGTWLYEYTIVNPATGTGNVYDLYVPAWAIAGTVTSITDAVGWVNLAGDGFVDWTTFGSGVAPGQSLSGFSFISDYGPTIGPVQVSTDDGVNLVIHDTYAMQPVPEPTTMAYAITALGFGASFLGIRSRRKLLRK